MEQNRCEVIPANRHSGMFKPGQSGNLSGRPKTDVIIKELAKGYTELAINTLMEITANPKAKDTARVQAANALLDRAIGKPAQYIESKKMEMTYEDWLLELAIKEGMIRPDEPVLDL